MAFFQLTLKARRLEKMMILYQDEKMKSIEVSKGAKIRYTLFQKIRHKKILLKMRFKKWLKKVTTCPEDSWFHEKAVLLRADGTFENYILKSVMGFLGGIFLTYMFFMFFVFQLNFTLSSATLLCSIFGIILTLGLAFSNRVRCVVFLLLPQFFSKRGRQALMAYAFILALTGPAKNTLHNMGVLSESLACGQEQLKAAVKTIVDLIKQPFYALRDSIAKVMKSIRAVVKKIKEALLAIKRIVLSILKVIKAVFQWLGSIMNICNKKLGTPFDRCQKVFDGAVADCKASLGPLFGGICNLAYVVGLLCWVVKPFDFICMLVSFITDSIIGVVKKKIKKFVKHVKAMFYVKVKFSHSFHFETNQSKSLEEVATGIVTEIRSRTDKFLTVFDWMSFATSFFFMFMMLRVIHYRYKWLTSERFDNRYLTNDLREIDLRRARLDKETVLPLNPRERNKYIPLTSITLIKAEKIKLTKSAVFLWLTTFKLAIHMMADYSLYWMLSTIRYHGRFESKVETPNSVGIYVSGTGFLAQLYRSIVKAFSPLGAEVDMDTVPCLPDPIPPDLDRYTQIISLIFFCWVMAIFEPYGLRLRHVVMCYYHPDRARQRAVWLYNHIIRSRGSFLKFARRQLRRKFTKSDEGKTEKVTLKERLVALFPILRHCFGSERPVCLLCGAVERESEPPLIKCPKPLCIGLFCIQCFSDLQNLCTICLEPIDYGDLSDMSEERDSSDGHEPLPCGQKLKDKLKEDAMKRKDIENEKEVVEEEETQEDKKKKDEKEEDEEEEEEAEEEEESLLEEGDDEDDEECEEEEEEEECEEEEDSTSKTFQEEDKLDESESCSSSSTVYSYSYQDESPGEIDVTQQRVPYKDIEAQKIRDDVTIQVFNDPSTEEESSVSEHLRDDRRRRRAKRKKDDKSSEKEKLTESSYDDQSVTSLASIADTESLSTEEVDEEEVIQEEISEGSEEKKLLSKKRKKRGKKRNRMRKIVDMLSKPFSKNTCDRRCPRRNIRKKRSSLFDRIVNIVQTKPKVYAECPQAVHKRLRKIHPSSNPRGLLQSSTSEAEELSETTEASPKAKISRSHDFVELLSPKHNSPTLSGLNLTDLNRMRDIQHLEDTLSSGDNLYSKNYDSHRERRKKLSRKKCKKFKVDKNQETSYKYPHEKIFETKQLPRYLKPVIDDTKYNEINEQEIYGTPRSDKEKDSMNKLSNTRTTSSGSSSHNIWNIRSGDDECNDCFCSRGSSLTSLEVLQSPLNKYELDMSTIEEGSDESSLKSYVHEDYFQTETADEIVDVTGISSANSTVNLNKKNEYEGKKTIKRLVTRDQESTDGEIEALEWQSKKARQETKTMVDEEKVQNIRGKSKLRKRKCTPRSKLRRLKIKKSESISGAGPSYIVEEKEKEDDIGIREERKRRKKIDFGVKSPGEKKRKKRALELEEIGVETVENKKKRTKELSKEITRKEKFGNILKVFDFEGDKIPAEDELVAKLKKNEEAIGLPNTTAREVQTDLTNCEREDVVEPRIWSLEKLGSDTSLTETTDTAESRELISDYERKYQCKSKRRQAAPQKHRKSPRKFEKRRGNNYRSYYTDHEDSPQRVGHESYRSTFSEDEASPRKTFASEHRKPMQGRRNYHHEEEYCGQRNLVINQRQFQEMRNPKMYRDNIYPEHMEARDRRSRYLPEVQNQRLDHYSTERPQGQFPPDYRSIRFPASGDNAPGRYMREYSPRLNRNPQGYDDGRYQNFDRLRLNPEEGYERLPGPFSPEDGRRQRVRDMFEPGCDRREYSHREREPREQYNHDRGNYHQNYDPRIGYGNEEASAVPMYDPSSPLPRDVRTLPAEAAILRYPQRYPSPRNYPEGVDPYYGISSPPLNPYVPPPQQHFQYSPAEETIERVDQYYDSLTQNPNSCVDYNETYNQPVKVSPKAVKKNPRRSFLQAAPILRKFLPIFQKPELIMELKEHDKMRLIQEREVKERSHEFVQTVNRTPIPMSIIRSEPSRDNSKSEALQESSTSDHRENSEKRLPYQETEAFKEVVNEYQQRRSSKQQTGKFSDKRSLNVASQQADASTDVTELYPPKDRRNDTVSRVAGSFMNAFGSKQNKINKPKKGCTQRVSDRLPESKLCKNLKCANKTRNQKPKFEGDNPGEMSSGELNRSRKKNRRSVEEEDEDTTDNNETTR